MPRPIKTGKYTVLLDIPFEDAQALNALSLDLKQRGLIRRIGIKPAAETLLHRALQIVKSNANLIV